MADMGAQTFFKIAHELVGAFMEKDWIHFDLAIEHIRSLALSYSPTWVR